MAKRTVLRVDSMLELTDLQIRELAQKNGVSHENLVLDRQRPLLHIDHQSLYIERFTSICDGAKFLLARLPENYPSMTPAQRAALAAYIGVLEGGFLKALEVDNGSFRICQSTLHSHCCLLVAAFSSSLDIETSKTIQWLSKAEEYVLLTTPRDDLMTLSALTNSKGSFYILQKESQLAPLSDELLEDYLKVATSAQPSPEWYQQLEPLEQRFLRHILEGVTTKSDIANKIVNLSSRLRTLPGAANFRNHSFALYDQELNYQMGSERSASSMISSRDVQGLSQEVRDFHTQQNLKQVIDQCIDEKILDDVSTYEAEEGEEITVRVPVLVQTLVSPALPAFMQPDYKLVQDKTRTVNNFIYQKVESQRVVNKLGQEVSINLNIEVELQSTNHALNLAHRVDYTAPTDASCRRFVESVKAKLASPSGLKFKDEVTALLVEYEKVLNMGSLYHANFDDADMRELYLSSLEQLVMVRIGIAYGSCVSAKDRKAIEFISTDAMELYKHFYGSWLPYASENSEDRAKFIDLFSHLYLSRHHHRSAALNAPGSEGIKSAAMYSPADVCQASDSTYFNYSLDPTVSLSTIDDVNAAINELRSIVKKSTSYISLSWQQYKNIAKDELLQQVRAQPGTQMQQVPRLLNAEAEAIVQENLMLIKKVVCDNTERLKLFWNKNTYYKADPLRFFSIFNLSHPNGIKLIRNYLNNPQGHHSPSISQLYSLISNRLKDQDYRYDATKEFYLIIQSLYFHSDDLFLMKEGNRRLKIFYEQATGSRWQAPQLAIEDESEEEYDEEHEEDNEDICRQHCDVEVASAKKEDVDELASKVSDVRLQPSFI